MNEKVYFQKLTSIYACGMLQQHTARSTLIIDEGRSVGWSVDCVD